MPCSRRVTSTSFCSISASRCAIRSSTFAISTRRSCTSPSASARSLTASSLASTCASRRIVSASRSASATIRPPLLLAPANVRRARRRAARRVAATPPIPSPTSSAITVSISTPPGGVDVARGGRRGCSHPALPHARAGIRLRWCVALGRRGLLRTRAARPLAREVGGRREVTWLTVRNVRECREISDEASSS